MTWQEGIVGAVGDTRQETIRSATALRPGVIRHYVLNFHEIAANRFQNVPAGCGTLTVFSTFPVVLVADGEFLIGDEDVPPVGNAGALQGWNPSYDPGSIFGVEVFRPGIAFTVRRKINTLSVLTTGNPADYTGGMVPGTCHLWLGPDDVTDMGFGLPVSHVVGFGSAFGATMSRSEDFSIALHGETVTSPLSGQIWQPSRTELNGIIAQPGWTGAAGLITKVSFFMRGAAGNLFPLARYAPGVAALDLDFGFPIEIPTYQTLTFNADGRGPLRVTIDTNANMSTLVLTLRCKSWM